MKRCAKCGATEEEKRIFDGIEINEPIEICERCSLLEGVPIIKIPSTNQLKSSEKSDYVYKRLRRLSGYKEEEKKRSLFQELKDIEEESKKKIVTEEEPIKFVQNFHWKIQHERRRKGLTHKQLADAISEAEMTIKLIERNNLPENVLPVLKKLEQFFRIRLVMPTKQEAKLIERQKQIRGARELMDSSYSDVIDINEDKEYVKKLKLEEEDDMVREAIRTESPEIKKYEEVEGRPLRVVDFKKKMLDRVTIADLREIQRNIEKDFPTKTSEEIGKEQLEDFGKGETIQPKLQKGFSSWSDVYLRKKQERILPKKESVKDSAKQEAYTGEVPSIYELIKAKQKAKQKKEEIIGEDIEILED